MLNVQKLPSFRTVTSVLLLFSPCALALSPLENLESEFVSDHHLLLSIAPPQLPPLQNRTSHAIAILSLYADRTCYVYLYLCVKIVICQQK